MHVQTRRVGDQFSLVIGGRRVTIYVLEVKGRRVKLGTDAPAEVRIEYAQPDDEAIVNSADF